MKKSTKMTIIVAVLIAVIGIGLCVCGALMGGLQEAESLVVKDLFVEFDFDHEKQGMTFSKNEIREMDFDIGAAELSIVVSDDEDIINVDIEQGDFEVYVKNHELHIKSKKHDNNSKITIWIPRDFKIHEVDFSVGASDIYIEEIKADDFNVELGAANMQVDSLEARDISVSVGMGSAEITLIDSEMEDYNYEIECGAGSITVGSESFGGVAVERKINNRANKEIELECGMGEIIINF